MAPSPYFAEHPVRAALLITWGLAFVALVVSVTLRSLWPTLSSLNLSLATDTSFACLALLLLWRSHRFQRVGFTSPRQWRALHLYALPIFLVIADLLYQQSFQSIAPSLLLLVILVAFAEETLFRGLILQILLAKGPLPAILGSSVLFAALHLLNVINGDGLSVILPTLLVAFTLGVAFAVLRLLTHTLLPLIFLHAAIDYISYARTSDISSFDLFFTFAISAVFLLYGLSLYRSRLSTLQAPI